MHCTLFHTLFLNICTDLQIITYCYGSGLVATHVPSWGSSGTSLHLHGVLQPCASILFHTHGCYGALQAQSRCSTCSIYISLKSPNKASATDTDRSSSSSHRPALARLSAPVTVAWGEVAVVAVGGKAAHRHALRPNLIDRD